MAAVTLPIDPELLAKAIRLWGSEAQWGQTQEECAELIAEISRAKRGRVGRESLAEEVADVLIMALQARLMVGEELVDEQLEKKLGRLRALLSGIEAVSTT